MAKREKLEPVPAVGSEWQWKESGSVSGDFGRRVVHTFEWNRDQFRTTYIVYGEFRISDGAEVGDPKVCSIASWTKAVRKQRPYLYTLMPHKRE